MFAPAYPGPPSWPCDLATVFRNALLGCVVSGDINGDASEAFTREPSSHLGTLSVDGTFSLGEEVGPRNIRFQFRSAGGLEIDGDSAVVGCTIIDESLTAIAGPFTVQFTLAILGSNVCTVDVPGLSRPDILAGVTGGGPLTTPGTSTADFELSFS